MDYRTQRLKEDLTNAQQRNKKQRIQLANYKKCHERDLETIKKQKEVIDKVINMLKNNFVYEYIRSCDANGEFYQESITKQSFIDNIKSIVTHEQMEQMAYKVGE